MSTNCIKCMVKKRTGSDLLCDDCRVSGLRSRVMLVTLERDFLFKQLVKEDATWAYNRETNSLSFEECLKNSSDSLMRELNRIHELEPGETLDGS